MLLSATKCNSFLQRLFVNEYDECMLYCEDLSNPNAVEWLETESVHLIKAAELLYKYERTPWEELITPAPPHKNRAAIIKLTSNNFDRNNKATIDRAADIFDLMLNGANI